ncbi:transposase family protein [Staphylococcus argensis]
MCYDISNILGIEVKNLRITKDLGLCFHKQIQCKFYEDNLSYHVEHCDFCGKQNVNQTVIKHDSLKTNVYMGLVLERPAYLELKKQRFYCKACQKTYTSKTPYIRSCWRISTDVKLVIIQKLAKVRFEKDIASDHFVSPSTIYRHLKYLGTEIKTNHKLPQYLSFDEFKSTNDVTSAMSFIYCGVVNHDVIEISPDPRRFKLEEHFLKFSSEER